MNTPLRPQSVMDDAPEIVTFTPAQQVKIDEIVKKSMGRAATATRYALTAANKKVEELEKIIATTPSLQVEQKLMAALAKIAEHEAILTRYRDSLLQALALIS